MNVSHCVQFFKRKTHHKVSFFSSRNAKGWTMPNLPPILPQQLHSNHVRLGLDVVLWRTRLLISLQFMTSFVCKKIKGLGPECSTTGMGQFPICNLKWDFFRTSVTACIIFSVPFGIFLMRMEIWKKKFQKISYKTPQWGAFHLQTPVSKWELP